jgi:hypothetical protein
MIPTLSMTPIEHEEFIRQRNYFLSYFDGEIGQCNSGIPIKEIEKKWAKTEEKKEREKKKREKDIARFKISKERQMVKARKNNLREIVVPNSCQNCAINDSNDYYYVSCKLYKHLNIKDFNICDKWKG